MDETEFRRFMKRNQRTDGVIRRSLKSIHDFDEFLGRTGKSLADAVEEDLEAYASKCADNRAVKGSMHALGYYYRFVQNDAMARKTDEIRTRYLERKPFRLKDFLGIKPSVIGRLAELGIRNTEQILGAARTESERKALAKDSGVSAEVILELVKMSDLARIFGLKGIRARLYHDAGIDTAEKMARMDPDELIRISGEFIKRSGFHGIPPTPKEAQFTVKAARDLQRVVEY